MPIGLVASDPALENRSLQSLQGLGAFENLFPPPYTGVDDPNLRDLSRPTPDGKRTDGEPDETPGRPPTRRRSDDSDAFGGNDGEYGQLVRADDLMASGGGDDLNQALGSVQLLLEAFGGRPAR